jgi:ribonucleoside-diphosphate reductase alpha chain
MKCECCRNHYRRSELYGALRNTTREVAQHGRRGALMITMDIAHPDVEYFITAKQDLSESDGRNISVRLSDEFMQAVVEDQEYTHRCRIEAPDPKYTQNRSRPRVVETIITCAQRVQSRV